MQIKTISNTQFELEADGCKKIAATRYGDSSFSKGKIEAGESYMLTLVSTGTWAVTIKLSDEEKMVSTIKTETGGGMSITKFYRRKKYYFRKSQNLKLRFSLFNKDGDELLTIVPLVNWQKKAHDFVLQVNEEYENECDSLLILQAVHCANCSLSMMTGGEVPALISV